MLTSKGRFSRNHYKTNGFSLILVDFGTQVGCQNALKMHPKIYSKIKCVLASIFHDFGGFWEASWGRNGSKNRYKTTSKNSENLDAFWKRLWSDFPRTGYGGAGPAPPPIYIILIKNTLTHKRT